ncbi:OFA family MFS transporter [Nitrospirillum sp. BR 11164]|uniref:OFA family MFS transporter n=1 Tax=Nitrospirillum sp. BR 11164 TaxID=3104324 RepID=UPI002AFE1901|nr:OFA family MFS transporter [Nitrospirillum sp. BR 11164]MEA1647699.1 OFA family MFS transporter [Nitrospirillum sp. BR 11164]
MALLKGRHLFLVVHKIKRETSMSVATSGRTGGSSSGSILDRERIVAKAGFNRWLVPPAALAIHLCIGMVYGFSVFWVPLTQALGITQPVVCGDLGLWADLVTTTCDWRRADVQMLFTICIIFLGSSAALWGGWLERVGPRKAGVAAACCWCGGMAVAAVGIIVHQLWLVWLSGVIGGVGLGLGYISPVSTLIKWFPDRRGMATGMAIMGFGGGAMIGSPLANMLMNHFKGPNDVGVWQTFLVMAALYFLVMLAGAFGYRVPPAGWRPEGWTPPATAQKALVTHGNVHLRDAHKTKQFWLIWAVLCLNVSAGIGVLAVAAPMLQDIFGGRLIGHPELSFKQLDPAQQTAVKTIGAVFASLLSLFNIGGRFSGLRFPIGSAASPLISYFSLWVSPSTPWRPPWPMATVSRLS